MNSLFIIGGAKGVGKTTLISRISLECNLGRIETGKLVFDYVLENPP